MRFHGDNIMQNGYFRLISDPKGYSVALYRPKDGGDDILLTELIAYLDGLGISYDRKLIEMRLLDEGDSVCHLGNGTCPSCPESYNLNVSEDKMTAYVRFIPPAGEGNRLTMDDFLKDMRFRGISFGIRTEVLERHFSGEGIYGTDILLARGQEPVQGEDARIEYYFNTDSRRRPTQREDGSVDYFHLTTINQCRKGDELARIIPEIPGQEGHNIFNEPIKPREVRKALLKFGRNIELSEDKTVITTKVDGHVSLVDDKVFVADVYAVKDVDFSTGNLDYEGSIQVDGNVAENFEVKAGGNVIVNGLVEGARIVAGGDIVIAKGMNGMQKGFLKAGGNVIVKFLENVRVAAGGYVEAEAIMHSKVSAGTEVRVEGRKGVIVGGYVQGGVKVVAKTIGAGMGSGTIIEVGVNPLVKTQYTSMVKAQEELNKTVRNAETILGSFKEKLAKGVQFNEGQIKYIKSVAKLVEEKGAELKSMNERMERFRTLMEVQKMAEVVANNEIHPGTTIIIGDASRTLQSSFQYCKFVREKGEITMKPL